jgi:protoporphyrinogen oxidase
MKNIRVLCVGAGPAGLTASAELLASERQVTVLEKDAKYVGGISRTVQYKGFRFDIGGHRFFSKNAEIMQWWQNRLPQDFLTVKRRSRILYRQKWFDYPLRPANALVNLGLATSAVCVLSYLWRRLFAIRPERNFADWVTNRFGRKLFNIFFKTYTEKVWGMPCEEISADWASQRIKGLSLLRAIWDSFGAGPRQGAVIKTLIDTFQYPRLGPGMMWEKTRDDIVRAGGTVHMGRDVEEIHHKDGRVQSVRTRDVNGLLEEWIADQFIVSMPLRETILKLRPEASAEAVAAAGALRYRDFITVALIVEGENLFSDNWIYIHDPEVKVARVQNFNNWSREMVPQTGITCLSLEYFCSVGDGMWEMTDDILIELAKTEAVRIGLIPAGTVRDACVVRMEKAYPVYDSGYQARVAVLRRELDQLDNLQVIGRNGMHKYNNQDHSMMTGMLAARNLREEQFDLWRVNTDAEYQENGEVSETCRLTPKLVEEQ